MFLRQLAQRIGAWPRNFLRQLEKSMIFNLTEILRAKQFLRADDSRPAFCRALDELKLIFQIDRRIGNARHLREPDADEIYFWFC